MSVSNQFNLGVLAAAFLGFSGIASANDAARNPTYSAHFICGNNPAVTPRLVAGDYRASVAVRNRSRRNAEINAEIALTFPPGGPNPGITFKLEPFMLDPGQALSLDCDVLVPADLDSPPPYFQGFLTLSSKQSLDVTAAQSAADNRGNVTSISLEQILERR